MVTATTNSKKSFESLVVAAVVAVVVVAVVVRIVSCWSLPTRALHQPQKSDFGPVPPQTASFARRTATEQ